jgi:hypothetical protein
MYNYLVVGVDLFGVSFVNLAPIQQEANERHFDYIFDAIISQRNEEMKLSENLSSKKKEVF